MDRNELTALNEKFLAAQATALAQEKNERQQALPPEATDRTAPALPIPISEKTTIVSTHGRNGSTPENSVLYEWVCDDCGDTVLPGAVFLDAGPVYYPVDFCACPAGAAKRVASEREIALDDRDKVLNPLFDAARLDRGAYDRYRFCFWDTERNPGASPARDAVREYVADVTATGRNWLCLYGPYGLGKTHLAVAAVRAIAASRLWRPHIVVWSELCQATKESWSSKTGPSEYQLWARARGARILLLDDLDKTATSEWAMGKLFAVINYRTVNEIPTIVTANKSLKALKALWGASIHEHVRDDGLAVLSRIAGAASQSVRFEGKDQRWK